MYQLNPASIEDSEIYNQNNNQNKNVYKKPTSNKTLKNKNVSFLNEEIKKEEEVDNKQKLSNISKLISNLHNTTEDDNNDDNDDNHFKLYNENMEIIKINQSYFYIKKPDISIKSLFIYGKYVNDFHTIEINKLNYLNTHCIRELIKENNELKTRITKIEEHILKNIYDHH